MEKHRSFDLVPLVSWRLFKSMIGAHYFLLSGVTTTYRFNQETSVILPIYSSAYLFDRLCQSLAVSLFVWNPLFTLILCKDKNRRKVTVPMMDVRRKCSKSVILIMQQTARRRQTRQHNKTTRKGHTDENAHWVINTSSLKFSPYFSMIIDFFPPLGTFITSRDRKSIFCMMCLCQLLKAATYWPNEQSMKQERANRF